MGEFNVQTRNEKGELRYFATLSEAFYRAEKDPKYTGWFDDEGL